MADHRLPVFAWIALMLAILAVAWPAAAQRMSGELRLQVTDMSGGALKASLTIVGKAVGIERVFETDDSGRLTVRALPLGRYQLTVESAGFAPRSDTIEIQSQLPLEYPVALQVSPLNTTVEVQETSTLVDPIQAAQYLSFPTLRDRPSSAPGRSVLNLVNTQPGWLLEANGVLHPRGSEYDVQYVVDGVPLYDNRSPAFAQSLNIEEFESLSVRTAGYPAEFGLKLGGVIELAGESNARQGLHGTAIIQESSFANRSGFLALNYARGRTSVGLSGEAMMTDRYLDPPVEQNYSNHASGGGFSGTINREWSDFDRTRFYAHRHTTRFNVPNELLQEMAGQRQDRSAEETLAQASHTHIFTPRVLGQFRAMVRDTDARLWSNAQSTPIRPSQERNLRETYLAGSVSAHYWSHELKAGAEGSFASLGEDLGFHIVTYRLGAIPIFDRNIPQDFLFSDSAHGNTQSAFFQDFWRRGPISISAGLRFDRFRLIQSETAWSPRLGLAYELPAAEIVLHGSYDRVFQIPAMENVLLASSNHIQSLGGEGTFLPLNSSRGNFIEAGLSKSLLGRVRLDGNWYRRSFRNFADDSLLLNTGISFPIAFSEATIQGIEAKIETQSFGRISAELSYSNMIGVGRLPVAGGLFLGDEASVLLNGTGSFPISQDQRNTVRSRLRIQAHPRVWFAVAASYNSGLPFEIEGPADSQFTAEQYGTRILERVNFARGRVRPSTSLDLAAGLNLVDNEKIKLRLQLDGTNLTNRLNLINFSGVFSGTALDVPRSFALRLRSEF